MLERYSLLEIRDWLGGLLSDLEASVLPMPTGWSHKPSNDANVEKSNGLLMIRWREPDSRDRLKATFSYDDNGSCPLVSLIFDQENVLQELEVWRGDGEPLTHVPTVSDFEVPAELQDKSN